MSLKEEIRAELIDLDVSKIEVDRESELHGRPSIEVSVYLVESHNGAPVDTQHQFWFAHDTKLQAPDIAHLVRQYIDSGESQRLA